ncbi:MAG: hypothetical protein U1A06_20590, partial [Hoeflea sp.]|nr:hypothetical protein [Hoeflea sp.]
NGGAHYTVADIYENHTEKLDEVGEIFKIRHSLYGNHIHRFLINPTPEAGVELLAEMNSHIIFEQESLHGSMFEISDNLVTISAALVTCADELKAAYAGKYSS